MKYKNIIKGKYKHYLYRIEDLHGNVWYVGITTDPLGRIKSHCKNKPRLYVDKKLLEHNFENFIVIFYGGSNSHKNIHACEINDMIRYRTYRPQFPNNPYACNLKMCNASFVHDLSKKEKNAHRIKISDGVKKYFQNKKCQNPIRFAGKNFLTFKEAAKYANVHPSTISKWIKKGYSDFPSHFRAGYKGKSISVIWEGKNYPSYANASQETGIALTSLTRWIKKGLTEHPNTGQNKRNGNGRDISVFWEGTWYSSIKSAANAACVSSSMMSIWRRKGITSFPSGFKARPFHPRPRHEFIWRGKKYLTKKDAALIEGVSPVKIARWLKKGLTEPPLCHI